MKQEEILKALIEELFAMNELHQEYQDNDTHYVVDSQKEGNTLTIKVQLLENKDKQEFEKWLEQIDDAFFTEILDELKSDGLSDLEEKYNSKDYKVVIKKVKAKAKELAVKKIKEFQKLLN